MSVDYPVGPGAPAPARPYVRCVWDSEVYAPGAVIADAAGNGRMTCHLGVWIQSANPPATVAQPVQDATVKPGEGASAVVGVQEWAVVVSSEGLAPCLLGDDYYPHDSVVLIEGVTKRCVNGEWIDTV